MEGVDGDLEAGGEGEAGATGAQHWGERQRGGVGTGGGFFASNAARRVAVKEADKFVDRIDQKCYDIAQYGRAPKGVVAVYDTPLDAVKAFADAASDERCYEEIL